MKQSVFRELMLADLVKLLSCLHASPAPTRQNSVGGSVCGPQAAPIGARSASAVETQLHEPTPAQRKAMVRALHSFVRKYPQYALMGGTGRKTLLLYEPGDPVSAAWARLMLKARFVSFAEARAAI